MKKGTKTHKIGENLGSTKPPPGKRGWKSLTTTRPLPPKPAIKHVQPPPNSISGTVSHGTRKISSHHGHRRAIQNWWREILATYDRYPCVATILALPSDKEAYRYLVEFGKELDLISGEDCLVILFGSSNLMSAQIDEDTLGKIVKEHINKGYSLRLAEQFNTEIDKFPCLIFFRDIRLSSEHILVTLKGLTPSEMNETVRELFSVIRKTASNGEDILLALESHRSRKRFQRMGQTIIGQVSTLSKRAYEIVVKALIEKYS